jgi:hypothetical protein
MRAPALVEEDTKIEGATEGDEEAAGVEVSDAATEEVDEACELFDTVAEGDAATLRETVEVEVLAGDAAELFEGVEAPVFEGVAAGDFDAVEAADTDAVAEEIDEDAGVFDAAVADVVGDFDAAAAEVVGDFDAAIEADALTDTVDAGVLDAAMEAPEDPSMLAPVIVKMGALA